MAQPTAYDPAHEFLTDEAANPNFPGSELDIEFGALRDTLDETLANLALIQRDDGALVNHVVTFDSLSVALQALVGDVSALEELDALAAAAAASAATATAQAVISTAQAVISAAQAAALRGTSTSSVSVGLGSKSFTTQASKQFTAGVFILAYSAADPTKYISGQSTAYDSSTGALTINSETFGGSGTVTDWNIAVCGAPSGDPITSAFAGDSGAGGVIGMVPAPAAGDGAAGKVLLATGEWGLSGGSSSSFEASDITGAVDVTAELEAAIAAVSAAGGGELVIPTGTYLLTGPIQVPSNVVFVGEEGGNTVFKANVLTDIGDSLFINDTIPSDNTTRTNRNIGFRNIKLDGSARTYPAYPDTGYNTIAPLVRFSKVINPFFIECECDGHNNVVVQEDGCLNARIINNKLTDAGTPYWISPAIRSQDSGSRMRILAIGKTAASTVTITIASPGVVSWASHGLSDDDPILLSTTGALPTGLVAGTTYYIVNAGANDFQLSDTVGGTALNTSGSQSGTHTATKPTVITGDATIPAAFEGANLRIENIAGMTEFSDGTYVGGVRSGITITIPAVDSSAYSDYTYNGYAIIGNSSWIRSEGTLIADNTIRDGNRIGIEAGGTDIIVRNNTVKDVKEGGIYLNKATNAKVHDNTVSGVLMADISAGGFELTSVVGLKLHDNLVEEVQGSGMYLHSGTGVDIHDNTIRNPFKSKALLYPVNHGSVAAGIDGTALAYQHKHGIKCSNNDELLQGVRIFGNRFVSDLPNPNLLSAVTAGAAGGLSNIKNLQMANNDLSLWTAVRAINFSAVATAPVEGEILTGGTSGATGTVLYYDSTSSQQYVVFRGGNGTSFSPGETITGNVAASVTARSWDFDANLLMPLTGNSTEQLVRYGANIAHASEGGIIKSYTSTGTGVVYFDVGFVPSLVRVTAINGAAGTTNWRQSNAWVRNTRGAANTDHQIVRSSQTLDAVPTVPAVRVSGAGVASVVALVDSAGVAVNTAGFSVWTPYGFALNWTTHTIAASIDMTVFP